MNLLLIRIILLVVQLVSLSLGRAQLPANQPDGDQQHQVSTQVEQEQTIADDATTVAPSDQSVDSMETGATYQRRYHYPTHYNTRRYYNTNPQNNKRPYYNNRYPQSNNYVSRPAAYRPVPAYRPPTLSPEFTRYAHNVLLSLIRQAVASGATVEYNVSDSDIAIPFLNEVKAAGLPLVYNPNLESSHSDK